ncbi:MAG: hypothetical protein ACF788_01795, partial [Novipirellula sp. JB048]
GHHAPLPVGYRPPLPYDFFDVDAGPVQRPGNLSMTVCLDLVTPGENSLGRRSCGWAPISNSL